MDRGRRAEPYSNATIWTREIARNLAGHLSRVSKAHSCVDTRSPKSTRLPQFHHSYAQKRCPTSPMKTRQPLVTISRNPISSVEQELDFRRLGGGSAREEIEGTSLPNHNPEDGPVQQCNPKQRVVDSRVGELPVQQQLERRRSNAEGEPNQEISDRPVRIPAVKPPSKQNLGNGNSTDVATYNSPLHQKQHLAQDYYKRQEQRKIWLENQALIKRLQKTKATLNSKEWEKDDKWTQEFLKNQEKRRSALQQELRRAQVSPQALSRSKPLKALPHHHLKSIQQPDKNSDLTCYPTKDEVAGALSARSSARRGSKERISQLSRCSSDATAQQASAANHRRIMELRKQNSPTSGPSGAVDPLLADARATDQDVSAARGEQAAFIPDNEIVAVRFTFSRGRSRGSDTKTDEMEQSSRLGSLEMNRDTMSLSGAFSPGIELESALNEAAGNETVVADQAERTQAPEVIIDTVADTRREEDHQKHTEFTICRDKLHTGTATSSVDASAESPSENDLPDSKILEVETPYDEGKQSIQPMSELAELVAVISDSSEPVPAPVDSKQCERTDDAPETTDAADQPVETEDQSAPAPPEPDQTDRGNLEQEGESYEEDNFDDDPLPSSRATLDQVEANDKHEASGYASEFEEEPATSVRNITHDGSPSENQVDGEDPEEEASYSHDDFE